MVWLSVLQACADKLDRELKQYGCPPKFPTDEEMEEAPAQPAAAVSAKLGCWSSVQVSSVQVKQPKCIAACLQVRMEPLQYRITCCCVLCVLVVCLEQCALPCACPLEVISKRSSSSIQDSPCTLFESLAEQRMTPSASCVQQCLSGNACRCCVHVF